MTVLLYITLTGNFGPIFFHPNICTLYFLHWKDMLVYFVKQFTSYVNTHHHVENNTNYCYLKYKHPITKQKLRLKIYSIESSEVITAHSDGHHDLCDPVSQLFHFCKMNIV